jgi:hypothetical protein
MRFIVLFEKSPQMAKVRSTREPDHLKFLEEHRAEIPMAGGLREEHGGCFACLQRPLMSNVRSQDVM